MVLRPKGTSHNETVIGRARDLEELEEASTAHAESSSELRTSHLSKYALTHSKLSLGESHVSGRTAEEEANAASCNSPLLEGSTEKFPLFSKRVTLVAASLGVCSQPESLQHTQGRSAHVFSVEPDWARLPSPGRPRRISSGHLRSSDPQTNVSVPRGWERQSAPRSSGRSRATLSRRYRGPG